MEDFTGGVSELVELNESQKNVFDLVKKSILKRCMLSCAIEVSKRNHTLSMLAFLNDLIPIILNKIQAENATLVESRLKNGLLRGHAYSVTGAQKVDL